MFTVILVKDIPLYKKLNLLLKNIKYYTRHFNTN